MNPTLIRDCGVCWPANQLQSLPVSLRLSAGRTLADWDSFILTIKEDPGWPREGATLQVPLDPSLGSVLVQATGVDTGTMDQCGNPIVAFTFTAPANPGRKRYAFDVRGIGGTAGEVSFVDSTWLTVTPSVR